MNYERHCIRPYSTHLLSGNEGGSGGGGAMLKTLNEKRASITSKSESWSKTPGCVGIIISQHLLLWSSLYVAASTLYVLGVQAVFTNDVPSVVLLLVSSFVSLSYIALQNVTTQLRKNARNRIQGETVDTCQCLATHTLRILCTLWMVTVALNITFTAARRALCASSSEVQSTSVRLLDRGSTCLVNRAGILASAIALLACGMLFVLMHKVSEPFRCHLFGFIKEDNLIPLFLASRKPTSQPMFSEMSFKCRSSTSLSSNTLAAPWSESWTNLIPTEQQQPLGLAIYMSSKPARKSAPSLLHPRPSLASIRSHVTMSLPPPPTSPLPPLPAYFPNKYRSTSGVHQVTRPPSRPHRSDDSVRMIPPSPALSRQNLERNTSQQSLSSIYSRSTSGESRPCTLSETGRTASSSSTVTLKKSPLNAMTLAEDLDEAIARFSIDNVADLEAQMLHARGLLGDVERHSGLSNDFTYKPKPLSIQKTPEGRYGCAF